MSEIPKQHYVHVCVLIFFGHYVVGTIMSKIPIHIAYDCLRITPVLSFYINNLNSKVRCTL
jgi:hypothetical protein